MKTLYLIKLMKMNVIKSLTVLSLLTVFVAVPSLSSLLSAPGVRPPLPSEFTLSCDSAVVAAADTACAGADSVVVKGKKKKKKKQKKEKGDKMPFWTYYPPAMAGYIVYQSAKGAKMIKKMQKERMERIRDSLKTVEGVKIEMVGDSVMRVVSPSDTSAVDTLAPAVADTTANVRTFRLAAVPCSKTSPADVAHCDGSGVCAACGGNKRNYVMSQDGGRFVDCRNCGGTGKCPGCKGAARSSVRPRE